MEIRRLYFVIADISGYTRFVTSHKQSLLHAEKIIGDLLEAVMSQVSAPLKVHELLGDAVTMYAPVDTERPLAEQVFEQMQRMHAAFKTSESNHISNCTICVCDACANVDKLRLKVIAHTGEAAFTTVGGIPKISGEDVILVHRWLKNSIPSREYFLLTEEFANVLPADSRKDFRQHQETLEGLGSKTAFYLNLNPELIAPKTTFFNKLKMHTRLNLHQTLRSLGKPGRSFRNLPE